MAGAAHWRYSRRSAAVPAAHVPDWPAELQWPVPLRWPALRGCCRLLQAQLLAEGRVAPDPAAAQLHKDEQVREFQEVRTMAPQLSREFTTKRVSRMHNGVGTRTSPHRCCSCHCPTPAPAGTAAGSLERPCVLQSLSPQQWPVQRFRRGSQLDHRKAAQAWIDCSGKHVCCCLVKRICGLASVCSMCPSGIPNEYLCTSTCPDCASISSEATCLLGAVGLQVGPRCRRSKALCLALQVERRLRQRHWRRRQHPPPLLLRHHHLQCLSLVFCRMKSTKQTTNNDSDLNHSSTAASRCCSVKRQPADILGIAHLAESEGASNH